MVRTYDPKQAILVIGGVPIGGYADGTFISVERSSDTFEKVSGADGVVSRSKLNDFSGMLTVTLAQTSPSNDVLSGFAIVDEETAAGVVPIIIKDVGGSTAIFSAKGWIKKPANVEFGKSISNREWTLDLADMQFFVGGNPQT